MITVTEIGLFYGPITCLSNAIHVLARLWNWNSFGENWRSNSVTRFGQIPRFGKYLKIFDNTFKVYFVLGKVYYSLWHNLCCYWSYFLSENGQVFLKKLVIWLHCDRTPTAATSCWKVNWQSSHNFLKLLKLKFKQRRNLPQTNRFN